MSSVPTAKNKIGSTAAYITAAVLLIVLTLLCRKLDGTYYSAYLPFKPAEMIFETAVIMIASVFIIKHRAKGFLKKVLKYFVFAVIPLAITFAAFYYQTDKPVAADHMMIHTLDTVLSALSDDFILCAVGCTLLIHKANMKVAGVIIMLSGMAAYELFLSDETALYLALSVAAVIMTGFFEIQLHMTTDSALFCGLFHVLLHMAVHFTHLNSSQPEPYFGGTASKILYIAALLTMLVFGIILHKKRKINI